MHLLLEGTTYIEELGLGTGLIIREDETVIGV